MIFLSAGHNKRLTDADPGAVYGNIKEADLTIELRDLIINELQLLQANFITDKDDETLKEYIASIKPGSGSVVVELHFNSSVNIATGTEVIIKNEYSKIEKQLATDICNSIATSCGLVNRGVKTEAQSHRGRLGILHTKAGVSVLVEVCFINNKFDMEQYQESKIAIASKIALLLWQYDDLYK